MLYIIDSMDAMYVDSMGMIVYSKQYGDNVDSLDEIVEESMDTSRAVGYVYL